MNRPKFWWFSLKLAAFCWNKGCRRFKLFDKRSKENRRYIYCQSCRSAMRIQRESNEQQGIHQPLAAAGCTFEKPTM